MKNIRYILLTSIYIILALFSSCTKDFDEINTNPQGFTTASDGSLFNSVIKSLQPGWNEQFYIYNEILYKQTEMAALTKEAWGNFTIGTEEIWGNYYLTLPEIRDLEKRLEDYLVAYDDTLVIANVNNMKAMLKIVIALKTFKVTDLFGDMPFSEAGYGFQDLALLYPKYDKQRDIYLQLLDDLEWADEHIDETVPQKEPFTSFKAFDKLFNGDLLLWKKLANSLRLRHALRMSEKEPEIAGNIIKDVIENNRPIFFGYDFITPVLESACLWPSAMGFKNESLNWSFREHNNLRLGTNIWRLLSAHDSTDGSGIFDPRAFIFFETNNANKWVAYPQLPDINTPSSGGIPYGTHRDQVGAFEIKGETNIYSPFNYFIVRDEDYMPIPIITGAEIHYIKSEIYFRGIGVTEDKMQAEIEYLNGINSSVEWWMNVAENSRLPSSGMTFPEMISIPSNLSSSSVQFRFGFWNATSDEEKLRFIYTQRCIDSFRQPAELYALARRTGMTPRQGDPIAHFRLPYPPSEAENNSANWMQAIANQGGDTPEFKIWWIP
ncbi:MAG: SusD/RagB family nutrient-binding outer membrane lipoprotein [Bacteroidales bacterium]|nr:SusD/RagB family nutrient-binding outer membrane lipoprotein [Bacteroidales bacterium]